MPSMSVFLLVLLEWQLFAFSFSQAPPPNKHLFHQRLDHFNPQNTQTFAQRYFTSDTFYNPQNETFSSIFFYCGGEGDIEEFWNNTGLLFDIAFRFNAFIVFAEHRYYGNSVPSNNWSSFKYLSMEQAIADFAQIIKFIKTNNKNLASSPVIAFGGSYGGILSALLRIHFSDLFQISVASSAPWLQLMNVANPYKYFEIVTNDYAAVNVECPQIVRNGFTQMYEEYVNNGNYAPLQSIFQTCDAVNMDNFDNFINWIRNAFSVFAQSDYPYSSTMFGQGMPAWPVSFVCNDILLNHADNGLLAISESVRYFYQNVSQQNETSNCLNVSKLFPNCSDHCWCGTGPNALAWNYQQCTQIVIETDTNNVTDMFPPSIWELDQMKIFCQDRFGVVPDPEWDAIWQPEDMEKIGKYIIWSNGELDPWGGGGFRENFTNNSQMIVFMIPQAAHHYDLKFAHENDTKYVIEVRRQEVALLWKWLKAMT